MTDENRDVAATLERLYPPVIGGPGWDDVLRRVETTVAPETRPRRDARRSLLAPLAAVLAVVVVVAAPALALSAKARELVGLRASSGRGPAFVARVTDVVVHGPRPTPGTSITVWFTVGEQGRPPGTGIPRGSTFEVLLTRRSGQLAVAHGGHGYYSATIRLGPGHGIGGIQIGAFMPAQGSRPRNAGFWIPTVVDVPE